MYILLAPLYALFSVEFYKTTIRQPLSRGFLYLLYLSGIATLLLFFILLMRVLPQMSEFVNWAKAEMPALTWTQQGLEMNVESPYTMDHPELGPLVTFDMKAEDTSVNGLGHSMMLVTKRQMVVRQGLNARVYDLAELLEQGPNRAVHQIDNQFLQDFYDSLKPWVVVSILLFFVPIYFIWKLIAVLVASLIGFLMNLARREKLPYSSILTACFFAITASCLIQMLQLLVPNLGRIPFGAVGSWLLTTFYLYLAVFQTQDAIAPPTGPSVAPPEA